MVFAILGRPGSRLFRWNMYFVIVNRLDLSPDALPKMILVHPVADLKAVRSAPTVQTSAADEVGALQNRQHDVAPLVPRTFPTRHQCPALVWWQGLRLYPRHPGSEMLEISLNGSRQQVQVVGDPAPQEESWPLGPSRHSIFHEGQCRAVESAFGVVPLREEALEAN
jgi:hypothetical protein